MQQTKILDFGYEIKPHIHPEKSQSQSEAQKHKKFVAPVKLDINKFFRQKAFYFVAKRAFDIALSLLVVFFILSWLTPLLALLIKLESRGPVFFLQKRVGYLGKIFYCYKFRSMTLNKEADFKQQLKMTIV
jgi:putative colanic acid biosynthesis UDP-glucose lipid carrier transferase